MKKIRHPFGPAWILLIIGVLLLIFGSILKIDKEPVMGITYNEVLSAGFGLLSGGLFFAGYIFSRS